MAEGPQLCLRWNDFQSNTVNCFKHLRADRSFTDVTLVSRDGQTCKAHRMVLSACSPYFKSIMEINPSKQPVIFLDVAFDHLQFVLDFMYCGEVDVPQDKLPAFLKTAERLKVKGLDGIEQFSLSPD